MIIGGKARANGKQLGRYLIAQNDNERVQVLEINGREKGNARIAILNMSLQAEKTNGKQGLYHAHLAPAAGEDKLTREQWMKAADRLENELGYVGQNRVLVTHTKKDRNGQEKEHLHVVWQLEKDGKLLKTSHNYKAHDRTRAALENELGHKRTRQPNEVKKDLAKLWEQRRDGADFVEQANAKGYQIGRGYVTAKGGNRGYTVQTPDGQKLNLTRQLPKEVREKDLERELKPIKAQLPDQAELTGKPRMNERKGKAAYREQVSQQERGKEKEAVNDNQRVNISFNADKIREHQQQKAAQRQATAQAFTNAKDVTQVDTAKQKEDSFKENFGSEDREETLTEKLRRQGAEIKRTQQERGDRDRGRDDDERELGY